MWIGLVEGGGAGWLLLGVSLGLHDLGRRNSTSVLTSLKRFHHAPPVSLLPSFVPHFHLSPFIFHVSSRFSHLPCPLLRLLALISHLPSPISRPLCLRRRAPPPRQRTELSRPLAPRRTQPPHPQASHAVDCTQDVSYIEAITTTYRKFRLLLLFALFEQCKNNRQA